MLETVLMVVDFIVCVALIGAVLLQTGRGAGLSSSFGYGFVQGYDCAGDGLRCHYVSSCQTQCMTRRFIDKEKRRAA